MCNIRHVPLIFFNNSRVSRVVADGLSWASRYVWGIPLVSIRLPVWRYPHSYDDWFVKCLFGKKNPENSLSIHSAVTELYSNCYGSPEGTWWLWMNKRHPIPRPYEQGHYRDVKMNERDGVSNYRRLRVTGLSEGNPPVTRGFPHKGSITPKMFPFDDVIIYWVSFVSFCGRTITSASHA